VYVSPGGKLPEVVHAMGEAPPEVEQELENTWPTDVGLSAGLHVIDSLGEIDMPDGIQLADCGWGVEESVTKNPSKVPVVVGAPLRRAVLPVAVRLSPSNPFGACQI